ncbi:MAG TPA: nucleoside deaminase [Anaerolineaceae bacterium]|nr:nucleoside deaminase [Anaerolineaceae bacterium]
MWNDLALPWKICLEESWAAYCSGTIPIGAVILDAEGNPLARGRNQIIYNGTGTGPVRNHELAHAELNALLQCDLTGPRRTYALYTLIEPCPLCMGAFYMSGIRQLHYAAPDPYAGSVNLLNTTPYLSRKPILVFPPQNEDLQTLAAALHTEHMLSRSFTVQDFFESWREVLPAGVALGESLARSGQLRALRDRRASAMEMVEELSVMIINITR